MGGLRTPDRALISVTSGEWRLTAAYQMAGVPPGVERVEYEINLSGFDHLCIATRASDAPDL